MAANTSAEVFSVDPLLGFDVGEVSSTPSQRLKTKFTGSDGYVYMYVQANEAIGSVGTVVITSAGSASTDSGSAGWTANAPGGAAAGEYFWARRTSLA
jgi:hypothetical protein